jgi:hypothetical protein
MRCDRCRKLLSWYLESDLPSEEMKGIEKHLSVCKGCSNELKLLEETLALARGLPQLEPPEQTCLQLLEKVRAMAEPKEAICLWREKRGEKGVEIFAFETGRRPLVGRKARPGSRFWVEVTRRADGTGWSLTTSYA